MGAVSIPSIPHYDDSKAMMSTFKTITKLEGNKLDNFPKWLEEITTQLISNPRWAQFVAPPNPASFSNIVPADRKDRNQTLYPAVKSAMDDNAKIN